MHLLSFICMNESLWSTIYSQFESGGYSGVRESSGAEDETSLIGVVGINSLTKVGFGWSWDIGSVFGVGATTWIIDSEVDTWMDEVEGLVVIGAPKLRPRLLPRLNVLQPPPLPLSTIYMFDFATHVDTHTRTHARTHARTHTHTHTHTQEVSYHIPN